MSDVTITLRLLHGDTERLRIAEVSICTVVALAAPRTELDGLLARRELAKAGVYLLTGRDAETGGPFA